MNNVRPALLDWSRRYDNLREVTRDEWPGFAEPDRAHGDDRLEHRAEQAQAEAHVADRPGRQDHQ